MTISTSRSDNLSTSDLSRALSAADEVMSREGINLRPRTAVGTRPYSYYPLSAQNIQVWS